MKPLQVVLGDELYVCESVSRLGVSSVGIADRGQGLAHSSVANGVDVKVETFLQARSAGLLEALVNTLNGSNLLVINAVRT